MISSGAVRLRTSSSRSRRLSALLDGLVRYSQMASISAQDRSPEKKGRINAWTGDKTRYLRSLKVHLYKSRLLRSSRSIQGASRRGKALPTNGDPLRALTRFISAQYTLPSTGRAGHPVG